MKSSRCTGFCFVLLIVVFSCQPAGGQPADKYAEPIKTFEAFVKTQKGLNDRKILSEQSIALMYESMVTKDGRLTDYGMGWGTRRANGRFFVAHSGGQYETRTILYNYPTKNLIVAAATNFENAKKMLEKITNEGTN